MSEVRSYWKDSPVMIGLFMLVIAGITFAAWGSLVVMEERWATQEELGYAYIIPFVVAFFIWQNWLPLRRTEYSYSWSGLVLLLLSLFAIVLGVLSATHSITQYGYILAFISTILMFLGWPATRLVIAPLLLLLLIVPLPNFILNNMSSELQLISSQIGVWVIRLFGVSVYLEGNVIDLGKFQLQVVEACSGLRYLFPLISLSVIAAFIYQAAFWKRAIIVLSSIPITVFMNSFRIGVIGVLVEYGGIEQAEGFLHDFEGWFVFMACVAILFLEMWILVSFGSNRQKLSEVFAIEQPERLPENVAFKIREVTWPYIASIIPVVAISVIVGLVNERNEVIPGRIDFTSFPLTIGEWKGRRDKIEDFYLDELKLNDYIIADYANDSGEAVNLYLAYYNSQKSGQAAHSPRSCIPGGGWRIEDLRTVTLDNIVLSGEAIKVNRLFIKKGDYGQLVYYWFQQRGRIITNEYLVKWYLFWDALTRNRTDGALVRLTTPVGVGEDLKDADHRLIELLKQVEPILPDYIPD